MIHPASEAAIPNAPRLTDQSMYTMTTKGVWITLKMRKVRPLPLAKSQTGGDSLENRVDRCRKRHDY